MSLFARLGRGRGVVARLVAVAIAATLVTAPAAAAATWEVEGENDPSTFDCDHLYYSNYLSGMQFENDASGEPTIDNTVISKRVGSGLPAYWSTSMALGKDPDSGNVAAFYANYTTSNLTLYKHVSGTNTVTDEIAGGQGRQLPGGTNWGGIAADPAAGALYGAQNGGVPKLFRMDLATGATQEWTRGVNLTSVPPDDPVFTGGSMVPDMFVDSNGGAYYGISYGGSSYVYRLDPATGTTTQAVHVTGPASANGFNNYGMAYAHNAIYLGLYSGALYKVDPVTGVSEQVAGGNAHQNQVGRIESEPGGTWPITDLAACRIAPDLTKKIVVAKTADQTDARPGDKVTYTVTVRNTGTGPASGVSVVDDLTGVLDDATYNNDAVAVGPSTQPVYDGTAQNLTWTGDIDAGATVTITYSVTVGTPPGGDKTLRNTVTSPDGNCSAGCSTEVPIALLRLKKASAPADPKPGSTITYTVTATNDGTAPWTGATFTDDLTGVLDDAAYNNDATASSGAVGYDAAGRKLTWTGDVPAGSTVTVTYSVTVGSPPAGDKRLTNAVVGPDGTNCSRGSTDPDCRTDEPITGLVIRKTAAPATVKPGDTVTFTITAENVGGAAVTGATLTDDLTGVLDDADYQADAVARVGGTNAPTQPTFDAGTRKLTWTGDVGVGQTVTITYTATVKAPPTGDFSLVNTVTGPDGSTCPPGSTDPACGSVTPVGAVTVRKTADKATATPGERVTYTVTVVNTGQADYPGATFADDLTGVLDDATWDDQITADIGTATFDAGAKRLTWTGDVAKGATATITYSVTVGNPPAGDKRLRNVVTGPNCPAGSTDPACGTETLVRSVKLVKTGSPANPKVGDVVTYTVVVTNTGTAAYGGASFVDDLSDVLDDATWDGNTTATVGAVVFDAAGQKLTWTGDLAVGATATVTYTVTVTNAGDQFLRNVVSGDGSNCPPGSDDPDCQVVLPKPQLGIVKSVSATSVKPGEVVTYTVTVTETSGNAGYPGASFTDDLAGVLDDASWNGDATASSGSVTFDAGAKTLAWQGDVAAGATVTITYKVTVGTPPGGDKKLRNAVTGPEDSTCPPGGDCGTDTPVALLEIKKTTAPTTPKAGDTVTFTVVVSNTGEADYLGASFSDDLSGVLDDAVWNGDATATSGTATLDAGAKTLAWNGDVAKGGTVTVTYSVTVGRPPGGDRQLRNAVTGPDGATCPPGSTDPDCSTVTPLALLELAKTASPATAKPGEKVTYTVTVRNPGTATYVGATFSDDLTGVLDDATYNGDATAGAGSVTYAAPNLTWRHDLPAGTTVTVTYSVTVASPPAGDGELRNAVTGPTDSTCQGDCGTVTPVAALRIVKSVAPTDPRPGDEVTYTVLVTNTGKATYAGATFTDDLSGVLDDARYNQDAQATVGAVAYAAPVLTWNGDIGAGAEVRVTYSVTVNRPPGGDKLLKNAVTGTSDGNCPPGSTDPDCGTVTPVPALKLVKTGTPNDPKTGDTVTYTVTVTNVGEAAHPAATFTDDLTGVVDDATYNGDASASAGAVSYAAPKLTWTGALAKGTTATVTYSVTVTNVGDKRLSNVVTSDGSNCEPGSDDPDCRSTLPLPKLSIRKSATPDAVPAGGTVTYRVVVANTGEAPYRGATFSDDLTGVLDDASYNNDAAASAGAVTYAAPVVTWTGDVPAGAEITVTYTVVVGTPPAGDSFLRNAVTSPDNTNCPLPMPALFTRAAGPIDPACATETPIQALTMRKVADPAPTVAPGGTVRYTVTVHNTGTALYEQAELTDDLAEVLDNAAYDNNVKADTGTVTVTGTVLRWQGRLAPAQLATITYSVTVHVDATGSLRNTVVSTTPGANCKPERPDCTTKTDVTATRPPLADTGARVLELLLAALALLAMGVLLVLRGRRT
ncbi:DUF11 domain-containing protein [Actinosynnema sp. NPDC047251]|uniref:DUF7927 domain-containing protein n=1 Tax=Saccharothrix espanaensis (strain ATCC 51144 / DSM 44229 / JCM 9112 / NBRC 15066 / NRRL 15764) TaxID=1179773 RepID=K0K0Q4_SACES|nr:DUF11 domain-containing protein [Saccharothrix espanaensis]CCH30118.1 hypothetical protein BN6_28060 [Saccharothrix espanaensis DSM 44229]